MNVSINGKYKGGKHEAAVPVAGTYEEPPLDDGYSSPAGIASRHLAEVRIAHKTVSADPAVIADHLYLDIWIVKRHLFSLGLGPSPFKNGTAPTTDLIPSIKAILTAPTLTADIAKAIGMPVQSTLAILRGSSAFQSRITGKGSASRLTWSLVNADTISDSQGQEERIA